MHFDEEDASDGMVWITLTMRRTLLQYGDIVFLDAQKRQYNKMCWPYIGPVVKTNENKIRCVGESIVITESNSIYNWVIESIADMEPIWSSSQIKIIFADGLITQNLLVSLRITDTCLLRSDYYHHMHEVFPKPHNFGIKDIDLVKTYLRKMLLSHTKGQWKSAYNDACVILVDKPRKLEKLKEIFDRPPYYARYYVKRIPGNLNANGSAPSEANHFSITAHYGGSGAWTSMFHLHNLMERQQYFLNKDTTITDNLFMSQQNFESDFAGDLRAHDLNAKKCLSAYAYKEYWIKVLQKRMITSINCTMKDGIIFYGLLEPFKLKIISDALTIHFGVVVIFK